MAGHRKPTGNMGKRHRDAEKTQEAPATEGAAGPTPEREDAPELWGYSIAKVPGGFAAVRLSTLGEVEFITPMRHGKPSGEPKSAALLRMEDIQRRELVYGRGRR